MVELRKTQSKVTKLLDEVRAEEKVGDSDLVEFALVRATVYRNRAVEHSVNDVFAGTGGFGRGRVLWYPLGPKCAVRSLSDVWVAFSST